MQLFLEFGGHADFSDYTGTNADLGGGEIFSLKMTARPGFSYGDEWFLDLKKSQQRLSKKGIFCVFLDFCLVLSLPKKMDEHAIKIGRAAKI
ncbi:hypothetical protein [Janthinobacterium psychrotolerans]|uniref:hypothetical protein n=1 Tax=Janthinobacterium psychrotolerans TaxID=1747903 RepID=UPI001237865C|nr:hypothetical protein [Janthinobacterium psychrotolerans]